MESVALVNEHRSIEERRGDATRTHAERLPRELLALAETHHLPVLAVDLFAVASGPGSFTGLRIGIATIQGLALTAGRPIVAVSALEALAQAVAGGEEPHTFVAAWMDARRGDVFGALYRVADARAFSRERLVEVEGPTVGDPGATLTRWAPHVRDDRRLLIGDGAVRYADTISSLPSAPWVIRPDPTLLAGTIGRMAVVRAERGDTVDPAAVRPLYVRRPDAEIEREKRARMDP